MTKAFLLGAGLGTRLRPMTNTVPKPLVPVFHRPMAMHALDHLIDAGISEVAINTHHLHEEWQRTFPENSYRSASLHFFHEPDLLETGGGIKNIASFIGNDSLLVYNGDILTNIRLDKLITGHLSSNNSATLAVRSDGPAKHLAVDGYSVRDIRNKLGIAEGTHQFTGIYCIDPEILELIPANERVSIIPAFLELASKNLLGAYPADAGHWLDLGTRTAYLETHGISTPLPCQPHTPHIHETAQIHPSAKISNSWIGPHCKISENVTVLDSILWPSTSVSSDSSLTNCIVHTPSPVSGIQKNVDL
ncbi:MAG: sugar phosphate nucleotidyltransferase [Verrucomicrobiota bacterium]